MQSYAGETRGDLSLMTSMLIPLMELPNLGFYNLGVRLSRDVRLASEKRGELGTQLVNFTVQAPDVEAWYFNPRAQ